MARVARPPLPAASAPAAPPTAIRVVVADDHALVREGIAGLLGLADDLDVVGTAADLDDLLRVVESTQPDVVVTDIRMPPTNTDEGIRAAAVFQSRWPAIAVVVLSLYADAGYARALLSEGSGGRAYLVKSRVQASDELVRAVRTVAAGGSIIDPTVVETLLGRGDGVARRDLDRLTARERDVLAAMASGRSNLAIAGDLHVSAKTVETHVGAIFMKLGLVDEPTVSRRVAAVLAWLDQGDD